MIRMGKCAPAKYPTSRLMKQKRRKGEKEKRRLNFQCSGFPYLYFLLFFALFACFAVSISAQNLENLAEQIRSGDTEQKREALFQIRNFQTAEASRIASPALRDADEIVRATAAFSVIFLPKEEAARSLSESSRQIRTGQTRDGLRARQGRRCFGGQFPSANSPKR